MGERRDRRTTHHRRVELTCPDCGGDGLDRDAEAAIYYGATGRVPYCPTCGGSGDRTPTPTDGG